MIVSRIKHFIYKLVLSPILLKHYLASKNIYLTENERKLKALKNKHKGKRCFVIGNGPSLNKMNLSLLRNEYTFGVNGVFYAFDELGFMPTYYVVEDRLVAEDNRAKINSLNETIKIFPEDLKYCLRGDGNTVFVNFVRYYNYLYKETHPPKFSTDIQSGSFWGGTVTYLNLQLAYYMGFEEIYLIGMDLGYKVPLGNDKNVITSEVNDENHFHPDYFGPGKRWHQPKEDRMIRSLQFAGEQYKSNGRNIFNATLEGNLHVFPRVNYDDLFTK